MFIQVKLIKGYQKPLWYSSTQPIAPASIVQVPLRNKQYHALVLHAQHQRPENTPYEIKEITNQMQTPSDAHYNQFIQKLAAFYFLDPIYFFGRIRSFLHEKKSVPAAEISSSSIDNTAHHATQLTEDQARVLASILPSVQQQIYQPFLLHGVTGSGKTEIYKRIIAQAAALGKSTILLLPEVTLSIQFERILRASLPAEISIFGFHSATRAKEKQLLWDRLGEGKPLVIIGVHLPILLPITNLGCIIIDEEHEQGFQEKQSPKLNSKEVALLRAQLYGIPIVLGSATPSITSLYNVKKRNWKFLQLPHRFAGAFPSIQLTMLDNKRRKSFWISTELEKAIASCLANREQVLIYLNRRGFSFFVRCKQCNYLFECPNCSVSLTPHTPEQGDTEQCVLQCHYCSFSTLLPSACPECSADAKHLLRKGIGTQQAVAILQKLFPSASIARADLDTTSKKRSWQETVKSFEAGGIDILVGTQSITKGYHFPGVTLVGVLWADLNLNFPFFNTAETTLQQLIQVAGRAGRTRTTSTVILQIMNMHPIFNFLHELDYLKFYETELAFRKEANYPPFCRFVRIELRNTHPAKLDHEATKLARALQATGGEMLVLGPVKPVIYKIQKAEARHIYLKSPSFQATHDALQKIDFQTYSSSISIVPTP